MKHPMQPIEICDGIARFQSNAIVRFLLDAGPFGMNTLSLMAFDEQDREQFAQLIGYSVSGYGELPYASAVSVERADELASAALAAVEWDQKLRKAGGDA